MTRFPPADAVLTQVCMTRTAYAQLQGQEFYPSKAFGREWTDPLSAAEGQGQGQAGEKQWRERGIKVVSRNISSVVAPRTRLILLRAHRLLGLRSSPVNPKDERWSTQLLTRRPTRSVASLASSLPLCSPDGVISTGRRPLGSRLSAKTRTSSCTWTTSSVPAGSRRARWKGARSGKLARMRLL